MSQHLDHLLAKVSTGDRSAFAELYDAIAGAVYGTARKVLRNPAISEEVAQDVLLEVWRKAPAWDPGRGRATTWILTIAHRRAVDRVRSEQSLRDRTERAGMEAMESAFDSTADAATDRDEKRRVKKALASLSEAQRQAIELAYYQGHTYVEVAQQLDLPLGTVKTRMRDGLIRLREAMEVTR